MPTQAGAVSVNATVTIAEKVEVLGTSAERMITTGLSLSLVRPRFDDAIKVLTLLCSIEQDKSIPLTGPLSDARRVVNLNQVVVDTAVPVHLPTAAAPAPAHA